MRALIVHAHYERKSFTTAMKDTAVAELSSQGYSVEVSDLYEMGFDPIAKPEDFQRPQRPDYIRYSFEQRYGYETRSIAPDILAEVEKLQRADLLVLSFPIFWYSVPAILKGWIDRVLLSGVAYGGARRFYDRGGYRGKKALVASTLSGREHMFGPDTIHGEISALLSHLLRGTLGYVGMDVVDPFFAWHVPYVTQREREAILEAYRSYLRQIDRQPTMTFPKIDDFDDQLRPRK